MKRSRQILRRSFAVSLIVFAAIQFVPVDRTNPPIETEIFAPAEVRSILRRACYDCHSNETRWPWYSRVAPVSWLVASDVHEARATMNFSAWNRLEPSRQIKKQRKCWKEVEQGEMPLWSYGPLHPSSALTDDERLVLKNWSQSADDASESPQNGITPAGD